MIINKMHVSHCICLFFFLLFISRYKMAEANHKPRCFLCGRNHALKYCLTFRKMLMTERREALVGQDVCLNCFGYGHQRATCPSKNRCQTCQANHHTMIHRPRHERSSSVEDVPLPEVCETAVSLAVKVDLRNEYEKLPFPQRILTYRGATPFNVQESNPAEISTRIVPVVQCELAAGTKRVLVTLMVCPYVPKSHVVYDSVRSLFRTYALTSDLSHGSLDILHPGGSIEVRFALVKCLQFFVPPAIQRSDLLSFAEGRKLAHPEPYNYKKIDGVIGKDLEDRIIRGKMLKAAKNPNISTQDTVFGVIFSGSWVRSNIPFISSFSPLTPRKDGPFSKAPKASTPR